MDFKFYGITADKPTPSGNVYPRETLEKLIENTKAPLPLTIYPKTGSSDGSLHDMIGTVNHISLDAEGNLCGVATIADKTYHDMLKDDDTHIASVTVGRYDPVDSVNVAKDVTMVSSYIHHDIRKEQQ